MAARLYFHFESYCTTRTIGRESRETKQRTWTESLVMMQRIRQECFHDRCQDVAHSNGSTRSLMDCTSQKEKSLLIPPFIVFPTLRHRVIRVWTLLMRSADGFQPLL